MGAEVRSGLRDCGGCGIPPGGDHLDECDHALCPECGEQRIFHDEHESDRPSRWHGISPQKEVAQRLGWWTTAIGIDHLVEDYTRVLFADALGQIAWDRETQRFRIGQIDEVALDAAIKQSDEGRHGR
jgi:hypothetical protein